MKLQNLPWAHALSLLACLAIALLVGCQPAAEKKPAAGTTAANADHGHDHGGHSHSHGEHGPHGGHLIVLEPGHVHAEWDHDKSNLVTVFLDDLAATPTEVSFVVRAGDAEPQTFALTKSTSQEADMADAWTVQGDALLTHINMGEAAKVKLVVKTADGELSAEVKHAEEHDHKH